MRPRVELLGIIFNIPARQVSAENTVYIVFTVKTNEDTPSFWEITCPELIYGSVFKDTPPEVGKTQVRVWGSFLDSVFLFHREGIRTKHIVECYSVSLET